MTLCNPFPALSRSLIRFCESVMYGHVRVRGSGADPAPEDPKRLDLGSLAQDYEHTSPLAPGAVGMAERVTTGTPSENGREGLQEAPGSTIRLRMDYRTGGARWRFCGLSAAQALDGRLDAESATSTRPTE